jgi:ribosomal protein S18 acetylase RimI-like enzyme
MRAFAESGMEYAGLGVDTENASGALGVYERMGYVQDKRQVAYALDV